MMKKNLFTTMQEAMKVPTCGSTKRWRSRSIAVIEVSEKDACVLAGSFAGNPEEIF
jgi:hypothetical protein